MPIHGYHTGDLLKTAQMPHSDPSDSVQMATASSRRFCLPKIENCSATGGGCGSPPCAMSSGYRVSPFNVPRSAVFFSPVVLPAPLRM